MEVVRILAVVYLFTVALYPVMEMLDVCLGFEPFGLFGESQWTFSRFWPPSART